MSERSDFLRSNTKLADYHADIAQSASYLKPADAAACKEGFKDLVGSEFANEALKMSATKSLAALFRENNGQLLGDIRIADIRDDSVRHTPLATPNATGRAAKSDGRG